jgi:hypothetical protein
MKFFSVGLQPTFQGWGVWGLSLSGINPDGANGLIRFVYSIFLQNDENEGVVLEIIST